MDHVQPSGSTVDTNDAEVSRTKPTGEIEEEKSAKEDETSKADPAEETDQDDNRANEDETSEADPAEETEEENSTNEDETSEADPAEETEEQNPPFRSTEDDSREFTEENRMRREDLVRYRQLDLAFTHRDWEKVEHFISQNPDALTAIINRSSETIFHIIAKSDQDDAIRLLNEYLTRVPPDFIEQEDNLERTAITVAAIFGNTRAAKVFVEFNENLLKIKNTDWLPLHSAVLSGNRETVNYFLSVTPVENSNGYSNPFPGSSGLLLVNSLVENNLYDTAFDILKRHPELYTDVLFRKEILKTLASKPKGFASGSGLGYWKRLIYHYIPVQEEDFNDSPQTRNNDLPPHGDTENPIQRSQSSSTISPPFRFPHKFSSTFAVWNQKLRIMLWNVLFLAPSIRGIRDTKLMHTKTVEIVRMLCDFPWCSQEALPALEMPILTAAKLGIPEIVKEINLACPDSFFFVDKYGNNAIMLAVIHRQENIFNLESQIHGGKQFEGISLRNKDDNILHLAATLAPAREVPGAALQMQRELQWFQAVENYVRPTLYEERNKKKKTPRELFSEEHEILIEKGEKWMKDNASSCALVASLIITVVFASALALPGGNNADGIPNFLHKLPFKIFVISDALSLFSSTTSLLMFLGILTSRYSEEDFLVSLPTKLIIGLITLFISIASMTVAFGATIYIVLSEAWKWFFIPIALIGFIPVTLFAKLQFPLLVQIYSSTFAPTIFQPLKNVNLYI
ncbi:putative Ankyrin repeat-containing protein [Melia azedarach]|uniref:Ankyrin repeat-containing protein n=1 Tax=Melia azedarach TaxID=155640 RepID=A0ACC1Y7T8_MELAZ|nr:putative Ankyrin repeat-containing protein [Melia azedarach]